MNCYGTHKKNFQENAAIGPKKWYIAIYFGNSVSEQIISKIDGNGPFLPAFWPVFLFNTEKHEHQNKIGPRAGSLRLPNNKPRKRAHLTYYRDKSEILLVLSLSLSLSLQWLWIKEQRQKQLRRLVSVESKREMATLSLSCLALPSKLRNLSLTGPSSNQSSTFKSLGFSTNLSHNYLFSNGKCTLYS